MAPHSLQGSSLFRIMVQRSFQRFRVIRRKHSMHVFAAHGAVQGLFRNPHNRLAAARRAQPVCAGHQDEGVCLVVQTYGT